MIRRITLFVAALLILIVGTLSVSPASAKADPAADFADEAFADAPADEAADYLRARVTRIVDEGERGMADAKVRFQVLEAEIVVGPDRAKTIRLDNMDEVGAFRPLSAGDVLVVTQANTIDGPQFVIVDQYRLPAVAIILCLFFGVAVIFGRLKGLTSVLGLVFSIAVLALYVVPRILAGSDPIFVTVTGGLGIAFASMYLAHGVNRRTTIALASTLLTLGAAGALAVVFVSVAKLFGIGSEEAFYLQYGPLGSLNLRGLLLGGIIIGTLGVLDDITTAQVAAVEEIGKADPRLDARELYRRGISVGREHIASLVNTLALAYAGASLPLFLIFSINRVQPLWVVLNGEPIVEELVRTLVGSTGLIIAVPISTWFAALAYGHARHERRLA